jgi:uncharacterized protein (DUF488 family)
MTNLFTIGYEGAQLADFIRQLIDNGVDTLVDVRELPLSRRKGFSKSSLSTVLKRHGILYVHNRALGAPKPIRNRLRETGDYATYFRQFNAYLKTQSAVLAKLAKDYAESAVVLMCFEKNPAECHRSAVARELARIVTAEPVHLRVEGGTRRGSIRNAPRLHSGQGVPAA